MLSFDVLDVKFGDVVKVAVSGGSSYSGMCIARAFARAGWETLALLSSEASTYAGRKRLRIERLVAEGVTLVPSVGVEGGRMASWLGSQKLDVWVHHHHPMENFRSLSYDVEGASGLALGSLPELAAAWRIAGVSVVLYSGTYFECGEGGRSSAEPTTPYALLKGQTAESVFEAASQERIKVGKIVISSPTGALENEDRFTPGLLLSAIDGREFVLRSPDSVFDNIPGETLADAYVRLAADLLVGASASGVVLRPSGRNTSAAEWANWVSQNIAWPLGLVPRVVLPEPTKQAPPTCFHNPASERLDIDWTTFAEQYVAEWRRFYPFR